VLIYLLQFADYVCNIEFLHLLFNAIQNLRAACEADKVFRFVSADWRLVKANGRVWKATFTGNSTQGSTLLA
jgi:hypothetical protein